MGEDYSDSFIPFVRRKVFFKWENARKDRCKMKGKTRGNALPGVTVVVRGKEGREGG